MGRTAAGASQLAEQYPVGAQIAEFPGCGHSVYFESAEAFNDTVAEFVGKHL